MKNDYLVKQKVQPNLDAPPEAALRMIVVIPSCNEPELLHSLEALYRCRRPSCSVEVIVVINHCEKASEGVKLQNEKSRHDAQQWINNHNDSNLQFHIIYKPDIPVKHSGVGYARKTGMDEAVYRFQQIGVDDGVIIGFDADATCDENYFEEIERTFFAGKPVTGASIYFEHPIDGYEFEDEIYEGIVLYELYLRYLKQALRYAGFPYAYHTVGSSFAVSASAYVKQGGMNKRKAGEDFHFLHKIIPLGNYVEINTTRVIPSARCSDRVPFGTGATMNQWMTGEKNLLITYPLKLFYNLKQFFELVPQLFNADVKTVEEKCKLLQPAIVDYLSQNDYVTNIAKINANSASPEAFTKRFFGWFDALKIVKYLNSAYSNLKHQNNFEKEQFIEEATYELLQRIGYKNKLKKFASMERCLELLEIYRDVERGKI